MKIFLLEDDFLLHEIIVDHLKEQGGHTVFSSYDGKKGEEMLFQEDFDLILLDVHVPSIDGFTLLKSLREYNNQTPAIFITSLNTTKDLKEGFSVGADDYIKKPFDLDELDARIQNIQRVHHIGVDIKITDDKIFDPLRNMIKSSSGEYELRKKEGELLLFFLKNRKRNISLEEIYMNVWRYDDPPLDTTLRTYIKNLRRYVGAQSIINIKGVGYRFDPL